MAEAAYLGANFLGDLGNTPELLDQVRESDPQYAGSLAGAMAAAYHLLNGVGDVDTAHRLLAGAIETCADPADPNDDVLIEAIYVLFEICFYGGRPELWGPFDRAIGRLRPGPPEQLGLIANTLEDPARQAAPALARLDELTAQLNHETSPAQVMQIAIATGFSERIPQVRSALWRLVEEGRHGQRHRLLDQGTRPAQHGRLPYGPVGRSTEPDRRGRATLRGTRSRAHALATSLNPSVVGGSTRRSGSGTCHRQRGTPVDCTA